VEHLHVFLKQQLEVDMDNHVARHLEMEDQEQVEVTKELEVLETLQQYRLH
jgi:hypothetical protein|tara:strand:- start:594 stop:746 length:153 start_codon:yes stop_codon:yes gene_type:complete